MTYNVFSGTLNPTHFTSFLSSVSVALCSTSAKTGCLTLLEIYWNYFFPPGNPRNLLEIYKSLLEIFWIDLRVCVFVVNISYNSCISECISTKCLMVNQDQLILRLVISESVS